MSYAVEWMLRDSDVVFFDVNSKKIYHEDIGNVIKMSEYHILVQQVSCYDPDNEKSKVGGLAEEVERQTGVRDHSIGEGSWPMGSISIFTKRFVGNTLTDVHFVDINDNQRHGKSMSQQESTQFPNYIVNIRAQEQKRPSETDEQRKVRLDAFIKGLEAILQSDPLKAGRYKIFFPKNIGCDRGGGIWAQYEQVINNFAKVWNGEVWVIKYNKIKI